MDIPVFKPFPLIKKSLLQRLFKQHPIDNAIIEVNNLLASGDILNIHPEQIARINLKYEVDLRKEYALNLQEYYAVLWNYYIKSEDWSPELLHRVNYLAELFELPQDTIKLLKTEIGSIRYRQAAAKYAAKRRLLPNDKASLELLAKHLQLDPEITNDILKTEQRTGILEYVKGLSNKMRCTPDEHKEVQLMLQSFGISSGTLKNQVTKETDLLLSYWETEYLPLKTYRVLTAGILQKSEVCYYYAEGVDWYETRNGRYGTGIELINQGTLYVTNKRLVFVGNTKNSQIPFERILRINSNDRDVAITKDKGKNPTLRLKVSSVVPGIIMERVRRNRVG